MYLISTATACLKTLFFYSDYRPLEYKPLLSISPPKIPHKDDKPLAYEQ